MGTWAIGLVLVLLPLGALAQPQGARLSPNDPSALVARPAPQSAPIAAPAAAANAGALDATPRFVLSSVAFDGARSMSAERLAPAWSAWRGRPVTLADLRAIARAAEAIYAAAGYPFVAIVLNPQEVVGGAVRFTVVEGRISDLTVLGSDPVARRQATAAFEPLVNRSPLAAGDVEGAYERATAIPGLTVAGALNRGGVPGGMDLLIQTKRQEWLVYANLNDLYPDALGPWGALLGVDHYGGSAYGDEISGQVYESLDGGRQTVVRASYARGLNASGTTLDLTALGAWANPGRAIAPLDLATDVVTGRVAITQPIFERLFQTLTATAAFEANDQRTKVFSHIGLTDDRLRIVSLSVNGEWRFTDGARIDVGAEVRQGLGILGASDRGDPNLSRQDADPQATVGKFSLEGVTPRLFKLARLVARVEGQVASAPLTAPDQYEVGNLTIGRGYEPGALFGDDAVATSLELRLGPFTAMRSYQIEPFAFWDRVQVWTRTPGAPIDRTVNSVGGGLRLETIHHLHIDLTYAQPLDPPFGLGEPTPHGRVLLNVTMGLNDVYDALHRRLSAGASK